MTENQLYPISGDFFDSPSNSSNPLKYDLYALGLSNSNSSSGLYSLGCQHGLSPTPSSHTPIGAMSPISPTSLPSTTAANSPIIFENIRDNPMLTNAILIPRNNSNNINSNQSIHNHQQRLIADLSEYGLDALDASSLSPTLLQDVSLSASSPIHNSAHNITPNGSDGFYHQTSPTINNSSEITVAALNGDIAATVAATNGVQSFPNDSGLGSTDGDGSHNASDTSNVSHTNETLFGPTTGHHHQHIIPNSNAMWSDLGSAMGAMKNEPSFTMEEDYIFPSDKIEIQTANFTDINDTFLEVIESIEEFIPNGGHSGLFLSPTSSASGESGRSGCGSLQQLNSPQTSPVTPPQQLLQQQQHLQQSSQQQNHLLRCHLNQQSHQVQILQQSPQQAHNPNNSYDERHISRHSHHHHHHHVSSSPYEIYHSTSNKQQQQQHQNTSTSTFSPGSHNSSQSPLLFNSITPPPPTPSLHIGHRSPYQSNLLKSRNVHDLLKKEFSMSPDRNNGGQSVSAGSHMILSGIALSPSSGSSGFGSTIGGSNGGGVGGGNGNTCGVGIRRPLAYPNDTIVSRLSSSAPTQIGLEQIWLRREPRQHLLSTGSLAEAESFSSISTGSVLSPDAIDFSQDDDEEASTDYNSDHYDDLSSDNATSDNETNNRNASLSQLSSSKSKERFFWQYNVQAKGPKGKRLVFQSKLEDPHVLNEVTDPVFSPNCSVRGIKHSGKARKGDGNDLTPNPKKLHSIGKELDKLSRTINDMIPVSELPFNVRPKSRKEKNKLASRACRLKKKAQHEANKIKLHGLEIEHKKLLSGISEVKQLLALKHQNQNCVDANLREEFDQQIEKIYVNATADVRIAGETADFVNQVLDNIKSGVSNGGLE